ncbi:hypothetical protein BABINDRAFT_177647 [Babjeviella inositovora NRRL Y-12698]|uniref:FHA domain-containing protein n=1 Tax=Babjeviella inositovora NRRL Y-12698 TaxID=984486 RepID=A0A1E3QK40_9ASCO|nr:uncharacterized protein BABINDRAFT_177647 [Babjeviella inositovora NRRL Y-12698]ODQ78059.1 hypothetical protein BABINDRAFT_177647 [Babjeviella inositovora NRRL Y-12698]
MVSLPHASSSLEYYFEDLGKDEISLGRKSHRDGTTGLDLAVDYSLLSRRHIYFKKGDSHLSIRDGGSFHGSAIITDPVIIYNAHLAKYLNQVPKTILTETPTVVTRKNFILCLVKLASSHKIDTKAESPEIIEGIFPKATPIPTYRLYYMGKYTNGNLALTQIEKDSLDKKERRVSFQINTLIDEAEDRNDLEETQSMDEDLLLSGSDVSKSGFLEDESDANYKFDIASNSSIESDREEIERLDAEEPVLKQLVCDGLAPDTNSEAWCENLAGETEKLDAKESVLTQLVCDGLIPGTNSEAQCESLAGETSSDWEALEDEKTTSNKRKLDDSNDDVSHCKKRRSLPTVVEALKKVFTLNKRDVAFLVAGSAFTFTALSHAPEI